jgi:YidC/Oxa1 family membrane protein insertase
LFGIFDGPVAGAYHVVLGIAGVVHPALAIVVFTVAVRLMLHPLARAAARGERQRAVLAPEIKALQQKHGKNRERLAQEMAKLHRESGTSMFAGCLPMLVQIPFFIVMYRLFSTGTVGGEPNGLLATTLLGTPLGAHFSVSPVFAVLVVALGVVAWWSTRLVKITDENPAARLARLLPYGSVLATLVIPLAAGIYLLTTTAWGTAERAYLRRGDVAPVRR